MRESPRATEKTPTSSFHVSKRGSSLSNFKPASMHQKGKSSEKKPLFKESNKALLKRKESLSNHKSKVTLKPNKVARENNSKENYEQKLRVIKKGQIKHYRN